MNIFYKFVLLSGIRSKNQGFVLPIAIGVGIAMVLVATTMIIRAQSDRINNDAQQTKAKSKSIADTAVTQVLDFVNNNSNLLLASGSDPSKDKNTCNANFTNTKSAVCWNILDPAVDPSTSGIPPIQKYTRVCKNKVWVDTRADALALLSGKSIASANANFKLNSYKYSVIWEPDVTSASPDVPSPNPLTGDGADNNITGSKITSTQGTFDITAKVNYAPSTSPTDTQKQLEAFQGSQIRIQFNIPVTPAANSDTIPGLWLKEGDMTNDSKTGENKNLVASQVWLKDCAGGDDALTQINKNIINGTKTAALPAKATAPALTKPYAKFIPVDFPTVEQALTNLLFDPDKSTPLTVAEVTKILTDAGGNATTKNQFVTLNSASGTTRLAKNPTGKLFDISTKPSAFPFTTAGCLASQTVATLPRSDDPPLNTDLDLKLVSGKYNEEGIYFYDYVVSSLEGQTIDIPAGCKVRIFILGSIDNKSKITHNCTDKANCSPSDVQIYGLGTSGSFCFAGTSNLLDAFVMAPNYNVGVIDDGVVRGAIWAKSWGKESSCQSSNITTARVLQAPIKWAELTASLFPAGLPPKSGGDNGRPSTWKICQNDTAKQCDGSAYP
jgi:hypothetical protein